MTIEQPMFPPHAEGDSALYVKTDISPEQFFAAMGRLRAEARDEIERLIAFLDATEPDADTEPSLGWQTGNQWPEGHHQDAVDFHGDANSGDDREAEDEREPDMDDEPSLGWTTQTNQTSAGWQGNPPLGAGNDLEQGIGPVRKKRPASKTGNNVRYFAEVLV
jgi:hypothetical protein